MTNLAVDYVFLTSLGMPLTPDYVLQDHLRGMWKGGNPARSSGPSHLQAHIRPELLLLNGGSLLALQRILGHTSLEVVRLYVNLQTNDLVEQQWRYSPMDTLNARASSRSRPAAAGGRRS